MTPVFAHGELRLYLLSLVADAPRHGYDIIKALSDRFGGTYQPSPGTIYPRLSRLEEEGLVIREEQGRKSVYRITDAGRAELVARRDDLVALESEIASTVRDRAESVRSAAQQSMAGLRADLAAAAQDARAQAREFAATQAWSDRDEYVTEAKAARLRLKEAEGMIDGFRGSMRAVLRARVAHGKDLDALTVETIRTVLDQAETSIRATLR